MTITAARQYVAPITPSSRYKFITDFSQDIDLVALGGAPCSQIQVFSAGVIVTLPHEPIPTTTNQTSPTLDSGTVLPICADKIISAGTSITACGVYW